MGLRLLMLGSVEASVDGKPLDVGHARQRCVLAVLLLEANHPVSLGQLVERVWADRAPATAQGVARNYLSRLRSCLASTGAEVIRGAGGYALRVDEGAVDLYAFRRLIALARANTDDDQACQRYEQALALWRGEAFAGLDAPWLATAREQLAAERAAAQAEHADRLLSAGRNAEALVALSGLRTGRPFDERLAEQQMLALYRSGQQAEALRVFQEVRHTLAAELGIDPGPDLARLHQQILNADPDLASSTTTRQPTGLAVAHRPSPPEDRIDGPDAADGQERSRPRKWRPALLWVTVAAAIAAIVPAQPIPGGQQGSGKTKDTLAARQRCTGSPGRVALDLMIDKWKDKPGYTAKFFLTNNSAAAVANWTLHFSMPKDTWPGKKWHGVYTNRGQRHTVTPEQDNRTIPPGGTVDTGFDVAGTPGAFSGPTFADGPFDCVLDTPDSLG